MPSTFVNLLVDVATETTLALVRTAVDAINAKLPADPATVTAQTAGNASLASLDGKTVAVNTGAVVVASSALPADAATATLQGTGNTSLGTIAGAVGANDVALPTGVVIEAGIGSAAPPTAVTSGRAVRAWRTLAGAAYTALLGADGAAIASASNGVPVVAQTSSTWDISDRAARLIGAITGADGTSIASFTNAIAIFGGLLSNHSSATIPATGVQIKGSPGSAYSVNYKNDTGFTRYLQIHNTVGQPGAGNRSVWSSAALATGTAATLQIGHAVSGGCCSTAVYLVISSSIFSYTAAADTAIQVELLYK